MPHSASCLLTVSASFCGGADPLLEAQGDVSLVPNDVAITHATNFQLVTGPNMSGKSTYLRQVALNVLLAHIGCHVPADAATLPLLRRVFTRIGASDSLETGGSTFACEMRETTYIIRNLGAPYAHALPRRALPFAWRLLLRGRHVSSHVRC